MSRRRPAALVAAALSAAALLLAVSPASASPTTATAAAPTLSVSLTVPWRVIYPAKTTATVVVTAGGVRVPGAAVRIYGTPSGQARGLQYYALTNSSGVVSISLWIGTNTKYDATATKTGYTTGASALMPVAFQPLVRFSTVPSSAVRGHTATFTGFELPGNLRELPRLQVDGPNEAWHTVTSVKGSVDVHGNWSLTWTVPTNRSTGKIGFRATLPANQYHILGVSGPGLITIS